MRAEDFCQFLFALFGGGWQLVMFFCTAIAIFAIIGKYRFTHGLVCSVLLLAADGGVDFQPFGVGCVFVAVKHQHTRHFGDIFGVNGVINVANRHFGVGHFNHFGARLIVLRFGDEV